MMNARTLMVAALAATTLSAWVPLRLAPEIVVYASELSNSALSEFDFWNDASAPGGKLVGTVNKGDQLDPPPENDPHVIFPVRVDAGVAYRCWIHMKVGAPKGKSKANRVFVQFTNAVDRSNKPTLKPGTGSYLTAQGPTTVGWSWVPCRRWVSGPPCALREHGRSPRAHPGRRGRSGIRPVRAELSEVRQQGPHRSRRRQIEDANNGEHCEINRCCGAVIRLA